MKYNSNNAYFLIKIVTFEYFYGLFLYILLFCNVLKMKLPINNVFIMYGIYNEKINLIYNEKNGDNFALYLTIETSDKWVIY